MQGNLLFVGCSHTNGFWGGRNKEGTLDKVTWDTNNYAEIYAEELADSQCYIYSSAGACNSKYPRWIRHMLNTHKDVSGVVMQSTYWDRWVMSADMKQHHRELDPGFFTKIEKTNDKVICYDDYNVDKDWHLVEWFEKIKWESIGNYTEGCPEFNGGYEWIGFDTNYMHMKFHTEVATHLKTEEYQKDIALIDAITNVPVYVWRINDKVQYPEKFDTYKNLDNVRVFDEPADSWLLKNLNIDIKDMMLVKKPKITI